MVSNQSRYGWIMAYILLCKKDAIYVNDRKQVWGIISNQWSYEDQWPRFIHMICMQCGLTPKWLVDMCQWSYT